MSYVFESEKKSLRNLRLFQLIETIKRSRFKKGKFGERECIMIGVASVCLFVCRLPVSRRTVFDFLGPALL